VRSAIQHVDDLIKQLAARDDKIERSKGLAEYFVSSLFKMEHSKFICQYVDGKNDGGIDFYHIKENTFYILQSKFEHPPSKTSEQEILDEITKINNTLKGENPNKRADDFVNELRRNLVNDNLLLEIVWLTTNVVEDKVKDNIIQHISEMRKTNGWKISIDFAVFDKIDLERLIFDVNHGYVPYTGRQTLKIDPKNIIKESSEGPGVFSVVCNVFIDDILKWFSSADKIDDFLQKNIRGYLGENIINVGIQKSYAGADPEWFWYKHNGIIIFADQVNVDETRKELVLHNPQIVNGGQTVKALYEIFKKHGKSDNPARVLLRAYRLPYESEKTYEKSVEIIKGLNSQNKILPSDLRSNDMRQVRIEQLLRDFGYIYYRKREKRKKQATRYGIPMPRLGFLYNICKKQTPHEGIRGQVEDLFETDKKYNEIFNEQEIGKELSGSHVVLRYLTTWNLYQIIRDFRNQLSDVDWAYFEYTQYFVLAMAYRRLYEWKAKKFKLSWKDWSDFTQSEEFKKGLLKFAKPAFRVGREIVPQVSKEEKRKKERDFYRSRKALLAFEKSASRLSFDPYINKAYEDYYYRVTE